MTTSLATLESARDIAWDRYKSAVALGGTPDERRWACDQAVKADERAAACARMMKRDAELPPRSGTITI